MIVGQSSRHLHSSTLSYKLYDIGWVKAILSVLFLAMFAIITAVTGSSQWDHWFFRKRDAAAFFAC